MRTKRRQSAEAPLCAPLLLLLLLLLPLVQVAASSAVVRPTIFSDLTPASEQAAAQQQQQQQQQQAQATQAPSRQTAGIQSDGPQQQQQQQQQQSAQMPHQSSRINPLKSRFCSSQTQKGAADAALGLQSFAIDDLSLSASSFSNEQVRPHLARLNLDIMGGAWCPVKPISPSNFGKEWIQVKVNRSLVVSAIETQGRFAMGSGKEFAPSYQVEYSRDFGHSWHKWKDFRGSSLLRANDDVNTGVRNELSPPIVGANVIRILPFSAHLRTVCMRFELYGCQYDEGAPISYSAPEGVVEPRWGHLIDYTYDGLRQPRGHLSQGLGQLVDGVRGPDNFSFNNGFEWVGWKSMNGDVTIEFAFKTLRNFTGAQFHSNNLFSSGVEVFQSVDVHFGIEPAGSFEPLTRALEEQRRRDAILRPHLLPAQVVAPSGGRSAQQQQQQQHAHTFWSPDVLNIEYEPDKKSENSRPVTVHLKQRLANRLKFVLKFASKWILVSEVEFMSHPVELLALSSLNDQLTPQLMDALAAAKTYDEYVAILREHQLRRLVADAYLENFQQPAGGSGQQPTSGAGELAQPQEPSVLVVGGGGGESNDQPAEVQQQQQQQQSTESTQVAPQGGQQQQQQQQLQSAYDDYLHSLSGLLQQQPNLKRQPAFQWPSSGDLLQPPAGNMFANTNQHQPPQFELSSNPAAGSSSSSPFSSFTVISCSLVAILVLLLALFALSSQLAPCHQFNKKSPASHLNQHHSHHPFNSHLVRTALDAKSTAGSKTQLMLAHSHHQHQLQMNNSPASLSSSSTHSASGQGASSSMDTASHHYNPLFASSAAAAAISHDEQSGRRPVKWRANGTVGGRHSSEGPVQTTLRRLATLTSGAKQAATAAAAAATAAAASSRDRQATSKTLARHKKPASGFLFSSADYCDSYASTSSGPQLLVSLKEPSGGQPETQQSQLIVGLNQANPLAQQQIYSCLSQPSDRLPGDYAIPDLGLGSQPAPLVPRLANYPPEQQANEFRRQATIMANEHNYELIYNCEPVGLHQMAPQVHARAFSQQQQQQQRQQSGCMANDHYYYSSASNQTNDNQNNNTRDHL